eukprot:TRINITY_DN3869_c1_g2_i5.p1 TRINITY_DN3869_c1_g2~~TRINITY_DN3869_c1_g2_i5.p1  ORF type:complete len:258 (+),score=15.91 TRINITY_DN3869_c1_g2_i5:90-863(+)
MDVPTAEEPMRIGDWERRVSSTSAPGTCYWFNWTTGESTWETPDGVGSGAEPLSPEQSESQGTPEDTSETERAADDEHGESECASVPPKATASERQQKETLLRLLKEQLRTLQRQQQSRKRERECTREDSEDPDAVIPLAESDDEEPAPTQPVVGQPAVQVPKSAPQFEKPHVEAKRRRVFPQKTDPPRTPLHAAPCVFLQKVELGESGLIFPDVPAGIPALCLNALSVAPPFLAAPPFLGQMPLMHYGQTGAIDAD